MGEPFPFRAAAEGAGPRLGRDQKALFLAEDGAPVGYALSGAAVRDSQSPAKAMPMTLPPVRAHSENRAI
jgi:hypothetical protein